MNLRHPEAKLLTRQWGSGDSNPDASLHQILSLARLPVPALPQRKQHDPKSCCFPHPPKVTPTKVASVLELRYQPGQLWPAGFLFAFPTLALPYYTICLQPYINYVRR